MSTTLERPAQVRTRSRSGPFTTPARARRYWLLVAGLGALCLVTTALLLAWGNPLPFGTEGFWLVAERRATSVVAMLVVAVSQAFATVAFQTVTSNRILTPSIMGFEALYRAVQTTLVYVFGVAGLVAFTGVNAFLTQVAVMVALACALYGWLLSGRFANLHVMLLVGIVLGGGLGSLASFMQRMLTPSEFDVLAARMFGSVAHADAAYFPAAIPLVAAAAAVLWWRARRLNAVSLGRDAATSLGIDHRRETIIVLVATAVLIAVSTALVGPMTFLGFLVATLAYQIAGTEDHRHLFPLAALVGYAVLTSAYVVLNHVFHAAGVVSIIIELVGGTLFLVVLLRKGRL